MCECTVRAACIPAIGRNFMSRSYDGLKHRLFVESCLSFLQRKTRSLLILEAVENERHFAQH